MNLNYDKIKTKVEHGGNQWTSYSDLFLVLSVVFLLLYVVANLRSGTSSLATATALQTAKAEAEDLKKQIKVYEVLKDNYMKEGATQEEVAVYKELMGKMSLLEDDARKERTELFAKAQEARDKEQSLNRYQEMVKNIISANLVAQSRVKKREDIIEKNTEVIAQQEKDIVGLNQTIATRETEIRENNDRIATIEKRLATKVQEARDAFKKKKSSEKALQERIAKLRNASYAEINSLKSKNTEYVSQLQSAQSAIEERNRQAERLLTRLNEKENQAREAADALKQAHEEAVARERAAFERGSAKAKISAEARLKQEREFRAAVERENALYNSKVAALNEDLEGTRRNIKKIEGKYQESVRSLSRTNDSLQKSLVASNNKLNEQKMLAQRIKRNFEKNGISADIDPKSGDVTIQFQGEYFDTGRADLKNGMRATLERLMPVYAKSLLEDQKTSKRISAVEIVGFASPTYQGKYVDPDSLKPEDRAAVNFNMDLSYQRAKSIFEFAFDPNKMNFQHQKTLLPLIKVSGRSYLSTDRLSGRDLSSVKDGNYCQFFDCKKSQKVIIKFNLRDE